jgi:hypothetical protein
LNRETTIGKEEGGAVDSELRAFNDLEAKTLQLVTGESELGLLPGQERSSAPFEPVDPKQLTSFGWPIYA